MLRISIEFFAEQELHQATDYYDNQQLGLGTDFSIIAKDTFKQIAKSPDTWQLVKGKIHRCRMSRFPYFVYYRFDDECAYVLAISHDKRQPFYWVDRLSQ